MDAKIILTIFHLMGVALGAGGAFSADYIFFQCIKDHRISVKEMSFIENSSKVVWVGLAILFLSGIGLFLLDPIKYIHSEKFITKMIIVLVIAVNGIIFNKIHTPNLKKTIGQNLNNSKQFRDNRNFFILSGVVSIVSWLGALILGSLKSIPYSVEKTLLIYALIIVIVFAISRKIFSKYL